MSHPGSGWQNLVDQLNSFNNIEIESMGFEYHYFDDTNQLVSRPHKTSNSLSIWGDVILHNHQFTCETLLNQSYFIFWDNKNFDSDEWSGYVDTESYYRLRLFGMKRYYEMAQRSLWNPSYDDLVTFFKI